MKNIASIIMAAGRGSRMKAFDGNKTLLPLVPGKTPFEGDHPILLQILESLPEGPKCVIVNYKKDEVIDATRSHGLTYCEQPELNGTGGALLAAADFIEHLETDFIIITMGDVPFVKPRSYQRLFEGLAEVSMTVLGFIPVDKKQYGVLETTESHVTRIIEWKYWSTFPEPVQKDLAICNSGIYAVRRKDLLQYLPILASRPQVVMKDRNGIPTEIKEYFITDIVEYMVKDGLSVGCVIANDEMEAMGIDDPVALAKAQRFFRNP
ncbi:MAG: MobA-like NTP transferase domain containing protein [Desulfobacteraceae bacterium]|nr:MobA-like NTP transferase domain containing protein [Desulfobacteraceae bacterium]